MSHHVISSKKAARSGKYRYTQIRANHSPFEIDEMKNNNNIGDNSFSSINSSCDSEENLILEDEIDTEFPELQQSCISARLLLAFLSFVGCIVLYIDRVNITVAIVAMSNQTDSNPDDSSNRTYLFPACSPQQLQLFSMRANHSHLPLATKSSSSSSSSSSSASTKFNSIPEFEWSQATQGIILGSFYWGYICFQTVGGRMSELFGAKWIIGLSVLGGGLINLITPAIARTNVYLFIASRVVLGLVQSSTWPSFYALFRSWFSDAEKSLYIPWLDAGSSIGIMVASAISGELIKSGFMGGWPSVFYVSGMITILWFIAWVIFVTDDPRKHQWMSQQELAHIIANTYVPPKTKPPVPWCEVFTSIPFIAVAINKFFMSFSYSLIMLKLPAYLNDVIDLPIDQNGYYNSVINGSNVPTLFIGGVMASIMIRKTSISKTNVRKILETIAGFSFTICLALIPLAGCDKTLVISLLIIGVFFNGLTSGGDNPIIADMTNEYPATVYAVVNTLSTSTGFLAPYTIGLMINSNPYSMPLWANVFYLCAAMSAVSTVAFFFADATIQNWGNENNIPSDQDHLDSHDSHDGHDD